MWPYNTVTCDNGDFQLALFSGLIISFVVFKGLCNEMNIILKSFKIKLVLSVHAPMV
jgi:hypothetical protein